MLLGIAAVISPAVASGQTSAIPVSAITADVEPVMNTVRLSGTVIAPRGAMVSTSVGGLVEAVEVEFGDPVEPGQPLVRLDSALARHEVSQAEAAIAEAKAQLADDRRRLGVAQRLIKRGNIPENELEARQAQVRISEAAVERLRAAAAREHERLDRHTVKAPFAGVVARKATEAGEWVSPGTTLIELIATDDLVVDIPVPQKYYPQLEDGTPVELSFDALPDRTFRARRVALVPVSDPTARTFVLRVRPEVRDIPLTPGMSARATLNLATGEEGVVIPRDAVIRYPDGRTTVWVVAEGEPPTVSERQVEIGRAFDGRIHVVSGLEGGERIVVRGNELLRDGQKVRITESEG